MPNWFQPAAIVCALMFATINSPPVSSTQEARVLEAAREMVNGSTLEDWLIPHVNGNVRLQKPPLAYWLSAASFAVFGVSAGAGRVRSMREYQGISRKNAKYTIVPMTDMVVNGATAGFRPQ